MLPPPLHFSAVTSLLTKDGNEPNWSEIRNGPKVLAELKNQFGEANKDYVVHEYHPDIFLLADGDNFKAKTDEVLQTWVASGKDTYNIQAHD